MDRKLKLHHRLANSLGYDLIRQENSHVSYGRHLSKLLKHYKIDRVLDVGANVGQFAQSLRGLGYCGEIVSFEPTKDAIKEISQRSESDAAWHIEPFALGDTSGEFTINIPDHSDFASLHDFTEYSSERFSKHTANVRTEDITVKTLKQWLEAKNLGPDDLHSTLLKIDTQGHDMPVMIGAGEALNAFRMISTELSFISVYENSYDYLSVLSFLKEHNFHVSGIYPVSRDRKQLTLVEADCISVNAALAG